MNIEKKQPITSLPSEAVDLDSNPSNEPPFVLPTPRMFEPSDLPGVDSRHSWVGVEATTLNGETKPFLFYRNSSLDRLDIAFFIANSKYWDNADITLGPPLDSEAAARKNKVVRLEDAELLGIYVEAGKRQGFHIKAAYFINPEDTGELAEDEERIFYSHFDDAQEFVSKVIPN